MEASDPQERAGGLRLATAAATSAGPAVSPAQQPELQERRGGAAPDNVPTVEIPALADLIWLFEDEPAPEYPDPGWPAGLHSFRLCRGDHEVLFSLDPLAGDAYISLFAGGQEVAYLGMLRRIETLRIVKGDGYEGLVLNFAGGKLEPVSLQTRPVLRLRWDVAPLGTW